MSDGQATEMVDAQIVEEGQQVVVHHHHDMAVELFPGATPAEVIQQATAVADALKPILQAQGMTTRIGPKDHVQIEGWQTLGALLKVTPVCVSTRRIEPKAMYTVKGKKRKWGKVDGRRQVVEEFDYSYEVEGYSWESTVEARTLDGRTIGSADAMCSREEDKWKDDDDFALRSMAQTRAGSKALASVLRFVVTLAGYSGTPAEEMQNVGNGGGEAAAPEPAKAEPVVRLTPERTERIMGGFKVLKLTWGAIGVLLGSCNIDGLASNTLEALNERIAGLGEVEANTLEAEIEKRVAANEQDTAATTPDTPPAEGEQDGGEGNVA